MSNPIKDSLLFMSIARENLKEAIELSKVKNKYDLANYIQNEASDFEVMSLLVFGEMSEVKNDLYLEQFVWEIFKKQLTENYSVLSESVPEMAMDDVIFELGPVSQFGYSSAKPILEFHYAQGKLTNDYLNELDWKDVVGTAKEMKKKGVSGSIDTATKHYDKATPKGAGSQFAHAVGKTITTGVSGAVKKTGEVVASGKEKIRRKLNPTNWEKVVDFVKDKGNSAKDMASKFMKTYGKETKIASGVALASLLAYGAYKLYKNNMTKAAQACKGSDNKAACMGQYKEKAKQAQAKDLRASMSACSKSKDPQQCKQMIQQKISKLTA